MIWLTIMALIGVSLVYFGIGVLVVYFAGGCEDDPRVWIICLWPVVVLMYAAVKIRELFLKLIQKIKERLSKKNDASSEELHTGETKNT